MKIILFIGPMFSGKTTRLIYEIEKNILAKRKCLIIRSEIDNRTPGGSLKTHSGTSFNECPVLSTNTLMSLINIIEEQKIEIIGIDEGQFFNKDDFIKFIDAMASPSNVKKIFISGLNGDYMKKPFSSISALIPYSIVQSLSSICYNCGKKAMFSKRIVCNNSKILIGGDDKYKPSCDTCFNLV